MDAAALAAAMKAGSVRVLDVRGHAEWQEGHLPGVANIPVGFLPARLAAVPTDGTLVLQCQAGGRSSIASSLLLAAGRTNIVNLTGGYDAWTAAGLPTEK
jgi:hydroxyacylglutathione hydrolase